MNTAKEAGELMMAHALSLDALVRGALLTHETREASQAGRFEAQDLGVDRNSRLRANDDIKHMVLSAADNFWASGCILSHGVPSGYSLGATSRSVVEAMARAVYLMKSEDVLDQYFRWAATFMRSLAYAKKHQYSSEDFSAWSKANSAQYDATRLAVDALGGTGRYSEQDVAPTGLVKLFLKEVMPGRERYWYARVSAMSHTERSSIEILKDPDMVPHGQLVIRYPDESSLAYGDVFGPVIWAEATMMKYFAPYFGLEEKEVQGWLETRAALNDYFAARH
jgi:hypothetical protein